MVTYTSDKADGRPAHLRGVGLHRAHVRLGDIAHVDEVHGLHPVPEDDGRLVVLQPLQPADHHFRVDAVGVHPWPVDVEVPQRHVPERCHGGHVPQHPLAHELRQAVRIDRLSRRVLAGGAAGWHAVDRGRRREHEAAHARGVALFEQVARRTGVVAVVLERVGYRLRHDRMRREVQHGVDGMVLQDPRHENAIAGVTDDQRHAEPEQHSVR